MAKNQNGIKRLNIFAPGKKLLRKARELSNKVDAQAGKFRDMSDEQLSSMTDIFLQKISQGYSLDDIMVDAFATAREAIYRVTGMFAFKVQLMGAAVLH
jgi:preprotein translocase subunit SecA